MHHRSIQRHIPWLGRSSALALWLAVPAIAVGSLLVAGCDRTSQVSSAGSAARLTEVMSPNDKFDVPVPSASDPVQQPWVEIHNPSSAMIDLGSYTLTDNPNNSNKYAFPKGTMLLPGEYRVVFLFDRADCIAAAQDKLIACLQDGTAAVREVACEATLVDELQGLPGGGAIQPEDVSTCLGRYADADGFYECLLAEASIQEEDLDRAAVKALRVDFDVCAIDDVAAAPAVFDLAEAECREALIDSVLSALRNAQEPEEPPYERVQAERWVTTCLASPGSPSDFYACILEESGETEARLGRDDVETAKRSYDDCVEDAADKTSRAADAGVAVEPLKVRAECLGDLGVTFDELSACLLGEVHVPAVLAGDFVASCAGDYAGDDRSGVDPKVGEIPNCTAPDLVTGFRLRQSGEPILLYSNEGRTFVGQLGVQNQASGTSNGIDPETGEYGVIYFPTPGTRNRPINVRPNDFLEPPFVLEPVRCGQEAHVRFTVRRDVRPIRPQPEVAVQYMDLDDDDPSVDAVRSCWCPAWHAWGKGIQDGRDLKLVVGAQVCREAADGDKTLEEAPLELLASEIVDDPHRVDPAGNPVATKVELLHFDGVLPAAPCDAVRFFRIVVEDPALADLLEEPIPPLTSHGECVVYGSERPPVLVNEYQPRNNAIPFERIRSNGQLVLETPDWIEIRNVGSREWNIGKLALASGGDYTDGFLDTDRLRRRDFPWIFGYEGVDRSRTGNQPDTYPVDPGGTAFVLADNDGGTSRRQFFLQGDPDRTVYYSTHFSLQADRRPPAAFDEFYLVDSVTRKILDRVVLDFSKNARPPYDIFADQSVGRFAREGSIPDALQPGTITDCPTPGGDNQLNCEVSPEFTDWLARIGTDPLASPAAGEPVELETTVFVDADTLPGQVQVTVESSVDGGPFQELPAEAILVELAADPGGPAPGALPYTVRATLPGQADGAVVVYRLRARDVRLAEEVTLDEESAPTLAFRYRVGYVPPADAPGLSEVLPGNRAFVLPPFECLPPELLRTPDFAEIQNRSDQVLDLGGYSLTQESYEEDPVGCGRLWRFPEGTLVEPNGFLAVYFGPPPECLSEDELARYVHVTGFDLDACGEVLYLVAPDDSERGANAVLARLVWGAAKTPSSPNQVPCLPNDTAFGFNECVNSSEAVVLATPTPGLPNSLPPLFQDAYQEVLGDRNACPAANDFVQLKAVFFLDRAIRDAVPLPPDRVTRAVFVVDRGTGAGDEEFAASVSSLARCADIGGQPPCADPPTGYSNLLLTTPPTFGGPFGPIVHYRVSLTDVCGQTIEAGPFSFGTTAAEHPPIAINEVNRLHPVVQDGEPVSWIELFNASDATVDLSGVTLSNDPVYPRKAELPPGVSIGPRGFLVVATEPEPVDGFVTVDLDWAHKGDGSLVSAATLYLIDSTERGSCRLDSLRFDLTNDDAEASFGRDPDGSSAIQVLDRATPGESNATIGPTFVRGDANTDLKVNVTDMIWSLQILFGGETRVPVCLDALDVDDDGVHNTTDPVYLGNFLFQTGPAIPPPYPEPGLDPTPDDVDDCSE